MDDRKRHLAPVEPDSVLDRHRLGWRLYWRRKSWKRRPGRPPVEAEVRALIRCISIENPLRGAQRTHGELLKPGFNIAEATVAKYMATRLSSPSQFWRTFVRNHLAEVMAVDFITVPTATQRVFNVFVVRSLDRRCIDHPSVTGGPSAEWTALQLIQAFPFDTALRTWPVIASVSMAKRSSRRLGRSASRKRSSSARRRLRCSQHRPRRRIFV